MKVHLLPVFGEFFIDAIRRQDVEHWLDEQAKRVEAGDYSPVTVNNWLRQLKVIMSAAAREFEWERDPAAGIEYLDTSTHATYTEEQPNSLSPDEVPRFLQALPRLGKRHASYLSSESGIRSTSPWWRSASRPGSGLPACARFAAEVRKPTYSGTKACCSSDDPRRAATRSWSARNRRPDTV